MNVHIQTANKMGFQQKKIIQNYPSLISLLGNAAAQMAGALCYNLEGRGFESEGGHWIFLIYLIHPGTRQRWA
jgi:hypothetical protein